MIGSANYRQLFDLSLGSALAVVIDVTGSMGNEIEAVKTVSYIFYFKIKYFSLFRKAWKFIKCNKVLKIIFYGYALLVLPSITNFYLKKCDFLQKQFSITLSRELTGQ